MRTLPQRPSRHEVSKKPNGERQPFRQANFQGENWYPPARRNKRGVIQAGKSPATSRCPPHCIAANTRLNPSHTPTKPSANAQGSHKSKETRLTACSIGRLGGSIIAVIIALQRMADWIKLCPLSISYALRFVNERRIKSVTIGKFPMKMGIPVNITLGLGHRSRVAGHHA